MIIKQFITSDNPDPDHQSSQILIVMALIQMCLFQNRIAILKVTFFLTAIAEGRP